MSYRSWFENRRAIVATMHHKEQAIAPILEPQLGVTVDVPTHFDTDALGTFTRDIPRPGTQLEAAILKAEKALALTGETLAIASEGAFLPHPALPWLPCDRELVVLVDRLHQFTLTGEVLSTQTNYAHKTVRSVEEAIAFAQTAKFPTHGLVVMPTADWGDRQQITKGIHSQEQLIETVGHWLTTQSSVHLETDMRAMCNPTRMGIIAEATQKLVEAIASTCPQCHFPGFAVIEQQQGLPCALCHTPTSQIRLHRYRCQHCDFTQDVLFPDGVEVADPAQCQMCNP